MKKHISQPHCIDHRAGKKWPRPPGSNQTEIEKLGTGQPPQQQHQQQNLLKCKHPILGTTFNARTLNSADKINETVAHAKKYSISVICLQEHRIYHDDVDIRYQYIHALGACASQCGTASTFRLYSRSLSLAISQPCLAHTHLLWIGHSRHQPEGTTSVSPKETAVW